MKEQNVKIKAQPSKKGNVTSGKIIINTKGHHKVIDAVIFTSKQSEQLLEEVDKAYLSVANH